MDVAPVSTAQMTRTDKVNLWVVRTTDRTSPPYFATAMLPGSDPDDLYGFLYAVSLGWALLCPVGGLVGVGIAFLGDKLFGHRGNVVGVSLVVGLCVFAIVGAVSAGRRVWYAVAARRRYRDSNDQLDSRSRELIAVARAGHATLAIQFGVGLASALIVLLLWW